MYNYEFSKYLQSPGNCIACKKETWYNISFELLPGAYSCCKDNKQCIEKIFEMIQFNENSD